MLAGISACFGLELSQAFLSTLVSAAAGSTAAVLGGRALVGSLLKLIPGGGTLAGIAISAATAMAFTTALGEAYIAVLVRLFTVSDGEQPDEGAIVSELKKQLS